MQVTHMNVLQILDTLAEISRLHNVWYVLFGDAGYPTLPNLLHALKNPAGGNMTGNERLFNAFMSRLRIHVENCFGELYQSFSQIFHKYVWKVGSTPIAVFFFVATLLYNIRTIFYGNRAGCDYGSDLLMEISLEDYLKLPDDCLDSDIEYDSDDSDG